MEKEVWKVWKKTRIALWQVSDQGNIKKNSVPYKCRLDRGGYKFFGSRWSVHRIVAQLFVPNPENKPYVDHINTNKLDNRACNLRWVTTKENNNNPLTKEHQSEAQKIAQNKPEIKMKKSESQKGKPKSEEHKKHMSEGKKIYWQNKRNENQNN